MTPAEMNAPLLLVLAVFLLEHHKMQYLLFILIGVMLGGANGMLAAVIYWASVAILRAVIDFLGFAKLTRAEDV